MKRLKKKPINTLSKRIRQTPLHLGISLSLLCSVHHTSLTAATIIVNSTADSGVGTLRAALTAAVAGDNINCSAIAGGTITLASPLPAIAASIIVNNVGAGTVTINESNSFAALTITGGSPASIQKINITNPFNPTDTTVTPAATSFLVATSQLANLDTTGSTTLTSSGLNGTVIVRTGGALNLTSSSTVNAPTPVTVNVGGTLISTGSSITGSINDSGSLTLNSSPVSGTVTLLGAGTLSANGSTTVIGTLAANGTSSATLNTGSQVSGNTTVATGATLTVDASTLNTLDTFGITTLQNAATVTGLATVEAVGTLNATGAGTTIASLTSSGTTNLSSSASVTGNASILAGTTTLTTAAKILGSSTVAALANLSASGTGTTLNTLDTFGTTTLSTGADITGAAIVEVGGTLNASGAGTTIASLASSGTSNLSSSASVTGALSVLAGTTSLTTAASVVGASTVVAGANLSVNGSTLNTLDTFGTTTLTNNAVITGAATVEIGGTLNATNSSLLSSLIDNGTATLSNTPVTGNVTVGSSGNFTGTQAGTILGSLTSSGTSNLNTGASVTGPLLVLGGTTSLTTAAKALGASTVLSGATLTANGLGTTLNTLDTFGTTTLTNAAKITGAAIVEVGGTLNASGVGTTIASLTSAGTSNLSASSSVTGALSVVAGTTNLSTAATVLGASTVLSGANLNVDGVGTTLNTLDTFGTTTLTNGAAITSSAIVEPGGTLNTTNSFLSSLIDNGTATLVNTPVTNNVTVGITGTFTGSGALTTLGSLTSSGTSNLNTNASVLGALLVQSGLTSLQSGSSVAGSTTVSGGGTLSVDASTLNTLDTFGTTNFSNGATAASAMIEPGGRLAGVGTVLGTITNQGVFSPGINGVGTFSSGNYLQQANGTFESVVTPTSAGLSLSNTTAQLSGDLLVDILPIGTYTAPQTYTIVQAANVSGTFSSIALSTPALFQIAYFPTHVDIQLFPVFAMGLSGNGLSAADCFLSATSITPSTPITDQEVVTQALFGLQANEFQFAFNQMQPAQYSALTFVQLTNALSLQRSIFRHSALWKRRENFGGCPYDLPLPKSEGCSDFPENLCTLGRSPCCLTPSAWHGWLDVTGVWQQQTPQDQQYGYHDTSGLLSFGIDGTFDNLSVGLLGAYQVDYLTWDKNVGDATARTGYGGFYAMIEGNHYLVDISALVGYSTYNANRKIRFSSIHRTARGHYNSYEGVAGIGVGSYNTLCGVEWVPYARVDYAYLTQRAFKEKNADSLNLQVRPYNTSLIQTQFGVFFEHTCCLESGLLTPKLDLSYIGQFAVFHKHLRARFESIPTCTFSAQGWNYGRNLFAPTLSLTFFQAGSQLSFELGYTGQFGHRYWNQQGYASLDWKF